MKRKEENIEQNQGAQQGNIDKDRDLGKKSQSGTTSTDIDKSHLQKVENNDLDETSEEGKKRYSAKNKPDGMEDNRSGRKVSDSSNVDSGYTRTSAFDEKRESRGPQSRESKHNDDKSDNHAGTLRTTNYGPDFPGGRGGSDSKRNEPGGNYRNSDNVGRMKD